MPCVPICQSSGSLHNLKFKRSVTSQARDQSSVLEMGEKRTSLNALVPSALFNRIECKVLTMLMRILVIRYPVAGLQMFLCILATIDGHEN